MTFLITANNPNITRSIVIKSTYATAVEDMRLHPPLPARFIPWLALILTGYLAAVQMMKKVYIHRYKEWM